LHVNAVAKKDGVASKSQFGYLSDANMVQYLQLNSSCCGNSICHSRESGNPVFRSGPLLWVPARRGPSQGWHRRVSFFATETK